MSYELERITVDDQEKILRDASYDQKRVNNLLARGGHFNNAFELTWAIDRERDCYLFTAPPLPMTATKRYYFYYEKHLYLLIIDSKITDEKFLSTGHFDEDVDGDVSPDLIEKIKEAYLVYGPSGKGQIYREPLDLLVIKKEEK